ncbi:hypothetical protein QCN29_08265 [Streptomyces sp. HNM0663]|uniref:Uncharacterized protein n=1 Tax=Streptomyces chengmaiensis TaxID=3040919 RepID=A0ABT6HKG1_9ACTN|nr:hypothetical protein [Streptomyces chengmaiensis]MDH2388780.1 hypothetical protein [Streptomyces chengmaiensis]
MVASEGGDGPAFQVRSAHASGLRGRHGGAASTLAALGLGGAQSVVGQFALEVALEFAGGSRTRWSASRLVARAAAVFIEELELIEQSGCDVDVAALWAALEEVAPRAALSSAATVVVSLVPEDDGTAEAALRGALALRYNTVKPFLSLLGESKALSAATGGARVLAGVRRLPALSRRKVGEKPLLPREIDDKLVPSHWRKAVYANAELPQGRWTATRTWSACWSSCSACSSAVTSSPPPRTAGPTRAPAYWTAKAGRRCARTSWPG